MEHALEITDLNHRFGIPEIVKIVEGHGGSHFSVGAR